jgi:uncharacterized membrane protein
MKGLNMATQLAERAGATGYNDYEYDDFADRRQDEGTYQQSSFENRNADQLARFLGWFSIGLGLAEVLAPRQLSQMIGVENKPGLFRLMGFREIGHGVAILSQDQPAGAVWSRVVGDLVDLALLGTQLDSNNPEREKTLAATMSVLGVTALGSNGSSNGHSRRHMDSAEQMIDNSSGIRVKSATTIGRPIAEVYGFWRNFENLPRFMTHLESVRTEGNRSHWVALGPAGVRLEWEAETVEDRPNELISWRSLPGGRVDTAGYVRFRPAPRDQGTEIVVEMRYDPPGGVVGASIAKLFGESGQEVVTRDLQAFKNVIELGEVVHSDSSIYPKAHPARPSSDEELEKAKLLNNSEAASR